MISGPAIDNNDALSRRDQGLEVLEVTAQVGAARLDSHRARGRQVDTYRLTNHGGSVVDTHLLVVVQGLPGHARLRNASGVSRAGDPYRRLFLNDGVLLPGQSTVVTLDLQRDARDDAPVSYSLALLSGQGQP